MPVALLLQELNLQQFTDKFLQEMVGSVEVLSKLEREDYKDMGIPKGAMVLIMASCRELMTPAQQ
jgi:hypothetical protein